MKKKTKTVIGVILAVALVAVLVLPGQTIMNSENMSARKVLGE